MTVKPNGLLPIFQVFIIAGNQRWGYLVQAQSSPIAEKTAMEIWQKEHPSADGKADAVEYVGFDDKILAVCE